MDKNADKFDDCGNLAALVAAGYSVRDAAAEIGVAEKRAYMFSATDEFRSQVNAIRTEKTQAAVGLLVNTQVEAIETLRSVMLAVDEKASDRIAAAKAVLGTLLQLSENLELRQRLDDLERRAMEQAEQAGDGPA